MLPENAPVNKCRVAAAAIRQAGFDELNHPPYIPDLAPSDCFLFANLKRDLRGRRFVDDEEVTEVVEAWLEGKSSEFYCE